MKFHTAPLPVRRRRVTLYVRVWIEISGIQYICLTYIVTLYVRVWIEICGVSAPMA